MDVFALTMRLKEEGAATVATAVEKMRRSLDGAEKDAKKLDGTFGDLKGTLQGLAAGFSIGMVIKKFVDETTIAQNAAAQLNATLRSTGGVAGQSAEALMEHASALQKITVFGDDAVIGAQSLLLTFTRIQGDIFPKATEAVLNVAQAMGTDLKSAAIQVGKALNDPILGVTALARSGIQFTEVQKDTIKKLVETNQLAAAQTIILKELETQFGGSAEAARNTLGGALAGLQNAFGDLFEISQSGTAGVVKSINRITDSLGTLQQKMPTIIAAIGSATVAWVAYRTAIIQATIASAIISSAQTITAFVQLAASIRNVAAAAALLQMVSGGWLKLAGVILGAGAAYATFNYLQNQMNKLLAQTGKELDLVAGKTVYLQRVNASIHGYRPPTAQTPTFTPPEGAGEKKTAIEKLIELAGVSGITAAEQKKLTAESARLTNALNAGNLSLDRRLELAKQLRAVTDALANASTRYTDAERAAAERQRITPEAQRLQRLPLRLEMEVIPEAKLPEEAFTQFEETMNNLRERLRVDFGDTLASGLAAGIETAIATGSIGEGFKALIRTLLAGLGDMMVQFGKAALVAAGFMKTIFDALSKALPGGAIAASLAMIAVGAALKGAAGRAFGGGGGGGGGGYSAPSLSVSSGAMGMPNLFYGPTAAGSASTIAQIPAMNVTIIGPNDPSAQRQMQDLMRNAMRRGDV